MLVLGAQARRSRYCVQDPDFKRAGRWHCRTMVCELETRSDDAPRSEGSLRSQCHLPVTLETRR